jgi:two-component system, OmpR family, phosphate regulon response regulator PhoB
MGARVLVAEDEEALRALIQYNLAREGFDVRVAADGDEAMLAIEADPPDLVLLDWMLPGLSGLDICRRIRFRPDLRDLPIIVVTARGEEADRVRGLETGADDYVTKPFSVPELIARMRSLLRRSRPELSTDVVTFGDLSLDRARYRVRRGEREVHLGPTEFRLLDCLLQRPGRVYSRERLLDLVWGNDVHVEIRTVDVHVGRLRKALNREGERDPIRTVRAAGYALDETYRG